MRTPIVLLAHVIEALRAVVRPCAMVPRPIPYPQTSTRTLIGGER
jgi:hypothetical protein